MIRELPAAAIIAFNEHQGDVLIHKKSKDCSRLEQNKKLLLKQEKKRMR
jgi:hypothetical protein